MAKDQQYYRRRKKENHWLLERTPCLEETFPALASLNSVAKLSHDYCRDGISIPFPSFRMPLKKDETRLQNLVQILSGYFRQKAHHLNVNVLNRETLMAAYEHPEEYPNLTIRVSGYAVNFISFPVSSSGK